MKERRPIRIFIPNTITLANLALGCIAIMEAWNGRLTQAAVYIMICAVLDFFDGYAARMLKAYSELGKQLDSLADLVSFGVAPSAVAAGLLMDGASARDWHLTGFTTVIFCLIPVMIPVFSALRLARFNIEQHSETHFSGMPVPADAAAFASLALIRADSRFSILNPVLLHPVFIIILIAVNSWLMVATFSMFSFKLKSYRPAANRWRYLFAVIAFGLVGVLRGAGLFSAFILYILASLGMNLRLRRKNKAKDKQPDLNAPAEPPG